MTAVFITGADDEWTLLENDGTERPPENDGTVTSDVRADELEAMASKLASTQVELARTQEQLRIARIGIARLETPSNVSRHDPRLRDGRWFACFPTEQSSSDEPVLVAVCTLCGYAKPADLLGVPFHEGIACFDATRKIPAHQPRFTCAHCGKRAPASAERNDAAAVMRRRSRPKRSAAAASFDDEKLAQITGMGFELNAAREELQRSNGDVEKALGALVA